MCAQTSKLTIEDIHKVQHLRLYDAAASFHMGATQFKKLCRELGIPRWPQRKVSSVCAPLSASL
jgi:hypothetical protein